MAEYFEREATIKRIEEVYCADCNSYNGVRCRACGTGDAIDMIEDAPAADVAPVVHGRWMKRRNGGTLCSRCGHYTRYKGQVLDMSEAIACPWCGAKMDGESTKGDVEHGMGSKE